MKEYGGYLEWERYLGKEYHNGYRVDSVRSALMLIIKKESIRIFGYHIIYVTAFENCLKY